MISPQIQAMRQPKTMPPKGHQNKGADRVLLGR